MSSIFQKRVFFGHQSVGENVLDGVHAEFPELPAIDVDSEPNSDLSAGIFHARIGKNGDALSKFENFCSHVLGSQREYDLALMKLCYVDIDHRCDSDEILSRYMDMIKRLQLERPNTKLIHVTVPLRVIKLGIRSHLKKLTGKRIDAVDDNARRHAYNESLRRAFGESHRVFDLARLESTTPSGDACSITYRGMTVPCLSPAYSTDGGHLNELGKSVIAREFVSMLQTA